LLAPYPIAFGSSFESSPKLADFDAPGGNGAREIVIAGSDGRVHVLDGATGRERPGFPFATAFVPGLDAAALLNGANYTASAGYVSGEVAVAGAHQAVL